VGGQIGPCENKAPPVGLTGGANIGTPEGIRTPGLLVRNQTLYPLSYGRALSQVYDVRGIGDNAKGVARTAGREGFEPSEEV
jgi:hypothetical protein